jgi:hypothetical protein
MFGPAEGGGSFQLD